MSHPPITPSVNAECAMCNGTGEWGGGEPCDACNGTGECWHADWFWNPSTYTHKICADCGAVQFPHRPWGPRR